MFSTKIEHLADIIVENDNSNSTDKEILVYGLTSAIEQGTSILTTAVLGVLFGLLLESLIFLVSFSMIRMYAGGYHCKKPTHCYIMSSVIMVAILTILKFTPIEYITSISIILLLLSTATIIRYAPVETSNKPLDEKEQKHYRRKTIQNMVIEYCIILILFIVQQYRWAYVIILGITITAILVIIQIKIRGESNG